MTNEMKANRSLDLTNLEMGDCEAEAPHAPGIQ